MVTDIALVDPFTGLELSDALQIAYTPYFDTQKVFDSNTFIYTRSDHDTWKFGNGPDKINQRSFFEDTFSATKILSLKSWGYPESHTVPKGPQVLPFQHSYHNIGVPSHP